MSNDKPRQWLWRIPGRGWVMADTEDNICHGAKIDGQWISTEVVEITNLSFAPQLEMLGWQTRRPQDFLDKYPNASEYVMVIHETEREARLAGVPTRDMVNGEFPPERLAATIIRPVYALAAPSPQPTKTAKDALQAIADLPTGSSEDVMRGHEDAYRAVEALFDQPPYIEAKTPVKTLEMIASDFDRHIKRAEENLGECSYLNWLKHDLSQLRAIITAAPKSKGIKKLIWHPEHGCTADGLGIHYAMGEGTPGLYAMYSPFHSDEMPQAEAQALAQEHFEKQVKSLFEDE